jgi:hypothetical protein
MFIADDESKNGGMSLRFAELYELHYYKGRLVQ